MVVPNLCAASFAMLRQIEPIIMLEQLGNTLFETALRMVARDRCVNATYPGLSREDSQQKAMTDFFMIYSLIIRFVPILPSLILGKLSDRGWRRAPIVVPLSGYLLSRLVLLVVVICSLPLTFMFGAAVLYGLSGGFSTFWPGVMTLVSLRTTATDRSKVMMRVELLYGLAGLVGSLVSGHLFQLYGSSLGHGTILLIVSTLLHLLCLILSIVLLQVKQVCQEEPEENCHLLSSSFSSSTSSSSDSLVAPAPARINLVNLALLFAAAFLYDFAVGGAIEILGSFVLKSPLSWSATQVGYGNAAGCGIFFTSFIGVIVFRRCVSEFTMILIGMLSFASGIFVMTFVKTTSMFYIARLLNLFALIPMPTIRSLVTQQVPASSCGITLTSLQLTLKVAGLAYIPTYTKIYQRTLDWLPGFVFLLSSITTVLGMIPISIAGCRTARKATLREDSGRLTQQHCHRQRVHVCTRQKGTET